MQLGKVNPNTLEINPESRSAPTKTKESSLAKRIFKEAVATAGGLATGVLGFSATLITALGAEAAAVVAGVGLLSLFIGGVFGVTLLGPVGILMAPLLGVPFVLYLAGSSITGTTLLAVGVAGGLAAAVPSAIVSILAFFGGRHVAHKMMNTFSRQETSHHPPTPDNRSATTPKEVE